MAEVSPKVGHALIIVNKNFGSGLVFSTFPKSDDTTRHGATEDKENLEFVFKKKLKLDLLDNRIFYNVQLESLPVSNPDELVWNHKKGEQTKCLTCRIKGTDYSGSQCFVIAISSHGQKDEYDDQQEICLSDHGMANNLKLNELFQILSDESCKSLKGIPRVIILTVCRAYPDSPEELHWDSGHEPKGTNDELTVEGRMPVHLSAEKQSNECSSSAESLRVDANTNDQTSRESMSESMHGLPLQTLGASPEPKKDFSVISQESVQLTENFGVHVRNQEITQGTKPVQEKTEDANAKAQYMNTKAQEISKHVGGTHKVSLEEYYKEKMFIPEKALQNLPENFLVVFGTYLGKKSVHDNTKGSWIIEEMKNAISEHDFAREPEVNFLTILTKVSGKVAARESEKGYKAAVTVYHRLTEPLILNVC